MDEKPGLLILTINSGSSSIKFSIYRMGKEEIMLSGSASGIGLASGYVRIRDAEGKSGRIVALRNHDTALREIVQSLNRNTAGHSLDGVGHRLVHGGGEYTRPHPVTPQLLARLNQLVPFARITSRTKLQRSACSLNRILLRFR